MTAFLINYDPQDDCGDWKDQDQEFVDEGDSPPKVSFKITRGSLRDPPSDLVLDRVCPTMRSELLPVADKSVPLMLWGDFDVLLTHADMSVLPDW